MGALVLLLACTGSSFIAVPRRGATTVSRAWQDDAERAFLDIRANPFQKLEALQRLAQQLPAVVEDVQDAASNADPAMLFAPQDREGARALARQLREDVVPALVSAAPLAGPALLERLSTPPQMPQMPPRAPSFTAEALLEELDNVYEMSPSLEQPRFEVLASLGSVEVRRYEPYVTASTPSDSMADGEVAEFAASGDEFSALASFVLGENERSETVGMTTPVEIAYDALGRRLSMAFSLPRSKYGGAAEAPQPSTLSRVELGDVPEATVAAEQFAGLATRSEVERALEEIRMAVAYSEDWELDIAGGYTVLQFNPPYTLPWRRTNAVLVPVVPREGGAFYDQFAFSATLEDGSIDDDSAAFADDLRSPVKSYGPGEAAETIGDSADDYGMPGAE